MSRLERKLRLNVIRLLDFLATRRKIKRSEMSRLAVGLKENVWSLQRFLSAVAR